VCARFSLSQGPDEWREAAGPPRGPQTRLPSDPVGGSTRTRATPKRLQGPHRPRQRRRVSAQPEGLRPAGGATAGAHGRASGCPVQRVQRRGRAARLVTALVDGALRSRRGPRAQTVPESCSRVTAYREATPTDARTASTRACLASLQQPAVTGAPAARRRATPE